MGRPEFDSRRASSEAKTTNPFTAWAQGRKERKKEAREKAVRMIANKTVRNETLMIDQLNAIDFLHSRLPETVLNAKSRENQDCCDLEFAVRAIVHKLLKEQQAIKIDIQEIDERLLTLILLFQEAVKQGDVNAAYAAKGALVRGVNEIRTRIPNNRPQLARQFVEKNAAYLDQWITLVSFAQVTDRIKQNVESQEASYRMAKEAIDKSIEELGNLIEKDPAYSRAFYEIHEKDAPEERAKWSEEEKKLHRIMIDQRMKRVSLALNDRLLEQQKMDLSMSEAKYEALKAMVAQVPIVTDPDLMNKFQEDIDKLFEQLAASDVEIDEMLKTMDDIEGRIVQLDNSPGAIRAREVAAEEAEAVVEEIRRRQEIQSGELKSKSPDYLKKLGIMSQEELKQKKEEYEAEELRAAEEMAQETDEEIREQEGETLYN